MARRPSTEHFENENKKWRDNPDFETVYSNLRERRRYADATKSCQKCRTVFTSLETPSPYILLPKEIRETKNEMKERENKTAELVNMILQREQENVELTQNNEELYAIISMKTKREYSSSEKMRAGHQELHVMRSRLKEMISSAKGEQYEQGRIIESLQTLEKQSSDMQAKMLTNDGLLEALVKFKNDTKPKLSEWPEELMSLYTNLKPRIGPDWEIFAQHLGLTPDFISSLHNQIKTKELVDFQNVFMQVMVEWRKMPSFSLHTLAEACRKIGIDDPNTVAPMSEKTRNVLKSKAGYLRENVICLSIVHHLKDMGVFSSATVDYILHPVTQDRQMTRFLDVIHYFGDEGFFNLKQALERHGYPFVVRYLEVYNRDEVTVPKTGYIEEDETRPKDGYSEEEETRPKVVHDTDEEIISEIGNDANDAIQLVQGELVQQEAFEEK